MASIYHDFFIHADAPRVFEGISTPKGIATWWAKSATGTPGPEERFQLDFGPDYQWEARVTEFVADQRVEFTLTEAQDDWLGAQVGFEISQEEGGTQVRFYHKGWPEKNDHYRISSYCWAMYLRILKRNIEHGEEVPYEDRLEV